jgi:hypothetical protein
MSDDFPIFSRLVHERFTRMSKEELFTVDTADIFDSYLAAFPEGTNPLFRERTEHDCSCCKQFIRNLGRTVAIIDGQRYSVWGGGDDLPTPYREVAARLNDLVQQAPINGVFRTTERRFGQKTTIEMRGANSHVWHHFHGEVAARHRCDNPDEVRGSLNTTGQVLRRGLQELTTDALREVVSLIEEDAIYRGGEFLRSVKDFLKLKTNFEKARDPDLLVWSNIGNPVARLRNSTIGNLILSLSEGMDTESAVKAFEAMVAPTNYKRPKSLITQRMIDDALKTLRDLGLDASVERRFARIEDVSVNDVLFVDNAVRGQMRDGLRDALMSEAVRQVKKAPNASALKVDDFVSRILPSAQHISLALKNQHLANFMSLTAPKHADAPPLFKWSNGFAWTYDGDVTDSIKERVKRAGGNTGAALRVSLAWSNTDDLDIHARCPDGHIYFGNKDGILDVDMNAHSLSANPVENLSWVRPKNGRYVISVNNYNKRSTKDVGFTVEFECNGVVQQFSCRTNPSNRRTNPSNHDTVQCIEFQMNGGVVSGMKVLDAKLIGGSIPTEKWGVQTERMTRVNTLLTSPNHWEGAGEVGAKHWFFVLEGCKNPDDARGFYNEFLRGDLEKHRKVFEVLGAKTKCLPDVNQLSGVGFTAGRGDKVNVTVETSNGSRDYELMF